MVEDVAKEAVEAGRARIIVEHDEGVAGMLISLVPENGRACAVSLVADRPPQMEMFLGPELTAASYEFWRDDRPANLTRLRELLTAVVAGRYEQTIETGKRTIKVTGRFELADGEVTHTEAGRPSSAKPGEIYTLRFEPY